MNILTPEPPTKEPARISDMLSSIEGQQAQLFNIANELVFQTTGTLLENPYNQVANEQSIRPTPNVIDKLDTFHHNNDQIISTLQKLLMRF